MIIDTIPEHTRLQQSIASPDVWRAFHSNSAPSLSALQQTGWDRFLGLDWPSRRHEKWRFGQPQALNPDGFVLGHMPASIHASMLAACSLQLEDMVAQAIFVDGYCIQKPHLSDDLQQQGVVCTTIEDAMVHHEGLVAASIRAPLNTLGSEKWAALADAYLKDGIFLYIPRGVKMEGAIIVHHWHLTPHTLMVPRTWVVAEADSSFNLVEIYQSHQNESPSLWVGGAQLVLDSKANGFRKIIQLLNAHSQCIQMDTASLNQEAKLNHVAAHLGGSYARFENQVYLAGPASDARLACFSLGKDQQIFDQRTLQVHQAPQATSDLLYKNVLAEASKSIFSGMIVVKPGAQQTDAYQTNRNLLVSDTAEAMSLPGLEIEANDVKCSHGATTAAIDAKELFYLQSRGIPRSAAESLIVFGFLDEVIQRVAHPHLQTFLVDTVRNRLA